MPRVWVVLLLAGIAFLLFMNSASANESPACRFRGTVKLNGAEVAGGTLVTAVVEGDEYHTNTPTGQDSSTYSITIRPPQGKTYADGSKVSFRIAGHPAEQTGTFKPWATVRLDLTASTSVSGASSNVWVIVGIVLALLVAGAVAYYILLLRRVVRKRFPTGRVPRKR